MDCYGDDAMIASQHGLDQAEQQAPDEDGEDGDTDEEEKQALGGAKKHRRKATQRPVGSDQKRQAFSKRKRGLVLKAYQLHKLTDAKVFLFMVNDKGSTWAYGTPGFAAPLAPSFLKTMRELAQLPSSLRTATEIMVHPKVDAQDAAVDDRHIYVNAPERATAAAAAAPQAREPNASKQQTGPSPRAQRGAAAAGGSRGLERQGSLMALVAQEPPQQQQGQQGQQTQTQTQQRTWASLAGLPHVDSGGQLQQLQPSGSGQVSLQPSGQAAWGSGALDLGTPGASRAAGGPAGGSGGLELNLTDALGQQWQQAQQQQQQGGRARQQGQQGQQGQQPLTLDLSAQCVAREAAQQQADADDAQAEPTISGGRHASGAAAAGTAAAATAPTSSYGAAILTLANATLSGPSRGGAGDAPTPFRGLQLQQQLQQGPQGMDFEPAATSGGALSLAGLPLLQQQRRGSAQSAGAAGQGTDDGPARKVPRPSHSSTSSESLLLSHATTVQILNTFNFQGQMVMDKQGNLYRIVQEPMVVPQFDVLPTTAVTTVPRGAAGGLVGVTGGGQYEVLPTAAAVRGGGTSLGGHMVVNGGAAAGLGGRVIAGGGGGGGGGGGQFSVLGQIQEQGQPQQLQLGPGGVTTMSMLLGPDGPLQVAGMHGGGGHATQMVIVSPSALQSSGQPGGGSGLVTAWQT